MKVDQASRAIRAGHHTAPEIANFLSSNGGPGDRSHVSRELNRLVEAGELERYDNEGDRGCHIYTIADAEDEGDLHGEMLLGDRDYDWEQYIPAPTASTYIQVDNERSKIDADIEHRHQTGELPHFLLSGPPGTGKTSLARAIAADRQWPLFELALTPDTRRSDLIGKAKPHEGSMKWADGPITRALLCSQERPAVLLLDEPNRARGRAHACLFPVLDHRCQTQIENLNETVQGDPLNLIVISAANIGPEFDVYDLDPALKRRLGDEHPVSWLGLVAPDKEQQLLVDETPIAHHQAEAFVSAANAVRRAARDEAQRIRRGIATSELIRWAQSAVSYTRSGIDEATTEAAKAAIVQKHYDEDLHDEVLGLLGGAMAEFDSAAGTEVSG